MKKIIYSIISILLAGFIVFGCLVGADVIKLNNDEKEQEQTQTDETIDITQHERYIALRAQNDALITEKNTLILQLEQKQIELEELQASSDANDVEKAEHIATLNQEITTMQITMDVLNNQIISLQSQLEQIEYINKTIDDMTISYNGENFYLNNDQYSQCFVSGISIYGDYFVPSMNSFKESILGFVYELVYNLSSTEIGDAGCMFRIADGRYVENYSTIDFNFFATDGSELPLDESYQYICTDLSFDYELYTLEEATDLNLGFENIIKTLNVTLKFDVVI